MSEELPHALEYGIMPFGHNGCKITARIVIVEKYIFCDDGNAHDIHSALLILRDKMSKTLNCDASRIRFINDGQSCSEPPDNEYLMNGA